MATRVITKTEYEILLDAYRERPGSHKYAAQKAGVGVRMAVRAWEQGWSIGKAQWARCIREVLEEERVAARARALEEQRALDERERQERMKAQQEAIDTLVQEGQLLKLGRHTVTAILATAAQIHKAIRKLADDLNKNLEEGKVTLTPNQTIQFMKAYAYIAMHGTLAAKTVIEAERTKRGEPAKVIGLQFEDVTLPQALEELAHAQDLFEIARKQGLIPAAVTEGVAEVVAKEKANGSGNGSVH